MGLTKIEKLIKEFKAKYPYVKDEEYEDYPESGEIQLDNLDDAKLVYDQFANVMVENEHGTLFPVSDLSNSEIKIFRDALKFNFC